MFEIDKIRIVLKFEKIVESSKLEKYQNLSKL